jgi:hypothetical protein
MATTVRDPDQAARPRARWTISAFGGLHALDGLLIAASAGVQYALARRR